jgi:uncharacterized protein (TIRG00374 family)
VNPPDAEPRPVKLPRLARALVIGVVLTVVAYAVLVLVSDLDAVRAAAADVPGAAIGLALLASTGNFVLRALRWDLYLARVGVQVPWLDRWLVFLAGFSMSLTPGKVGELLKPALLSARHGTPAAPVGSVVVAERIADLLAVAALLGLGALADPRVAGVAGLVWLGVLGGLTVLAWPRLAGLVVSIVRKLPMGDKVAGIIQGVLDSLRALSRPATLVPALLLSIGAWFLQCVSLFLVADGMTALDLTLLESVLAYTAPLLAGAAALVPGGVGVAEATMAGLVAELGQGPVPAASAATIIVRAVTLWWAVVVGLGALGLWTLRGRR